MTHPYAELIASLKDAHSTDSSWNLVLLCQRAAAALQAMERKPMTANDIVKMANNMHTRPGEIENTIRATEAFHNIQPNVKEGL